MSAQENKERKPMVELLQSLIEIEERHLETQMQQCEITRKKIVSLKQQLGDQKQAALPI